MFTEVPYSRTWVIGRGSWEHEEKGILGIQECLNGIEMISGVVARVEICWGVRQVRAHQEYGIEGTSDGLRPWEQRKTDDGHVCTLPLCQSHLKSGSRSGSDL